MNERERQRKMKLFWSAFGALPDFMPGVTAETISEQRRRSTEHQNRKLAKHWGYDPARLHRSVSIGKQEAILAVRWRREFARVGTTLDPADCQIAACAVTHGVSLATANVKDFPMEELTVEHWPSAG